MNSILRIIILLFFLVCPLIQQPAMSVGTGEESEKTLVVPSTPSGVLPETLTLEGCFLQQIIKNNPDLATARWNIQGAEARPGREEPVPDPVGRGRLSIL